MSGHDQPLEPLDSLVPLVEAWGDGYWSGREDGYLEGWVDARAHDREAAYRRRLAKLAEQPDYAEMCERRGEHVKAEQVRAFWRSTGLRTS